MMKAMVIIFLILGAAGLALAAPPVHGHAPSPEMRRQHESMSVTNKQWAVLKKSLAAGDFASAGSSLARMQKAAGALEKFKLHKNADRVEEFREQSRTFRGNLAELGRAVKENDKARAEGLSASIDNSCAQCHNVFR
ncbi:MAG: hypothetical protein Q7J31_04860 [Syntrophales bacterium]|nr:hypothetical protein [Syntrophales bacterium]